MEFGASSYRERLHNASKAKSPPNTLAYGSVKNRKRSRSSSGGNNTNDALKKAYFSLFLLAAALIVLLTGDSFFIQLYRNILEDAAPAEQLPSFLSLPFTYSECLRDERLLNLRITTPADEALTANSMVRMTVHGEFFRTDSSRGQLREAFVRVRVDDSEELRFPGGNNMTIPLDDELHLSFDLAAFGLASKKAPYKLTAEIFLPVVLADAHHAEVARAHKVALAATHSVHFFYIPVLGQQEDAGVGSGVQEPPLNSPAARTLSPQPEQTPREQQQHRDLVPPRSHAEEEGEAVPAASAAAAAASGGGGGAGGGLYSGQHKAEELSLTLDADDAFPGFRQAKLLSLAYRGGCSGANSANTGDLHLGLALHPQ